MIFINFYRKSVFAYFGYFLRSITLEKLLAKIECGSPGVVVARWVRPSIEHAQGVPLVREAKFRV